MAVPYTFGTATAAIPLSQLDTNFATAITIGNTAVQLGNTVTTLNNMTLANVTISSGNVTITNVAVTTANVSGTANVQTLAVTANASVAGNVSVTGNVSMNVGTITTANVTTANIGTSIVTSSETLSYGTANGVAYLNGSKALTTGSVLTFDGAQLGVNGITVGRGAGAVSTNTAVGASALAANTTGAYGVAVGYEAGLANQTGAELTLVGFQAGKATTGSGGLTAVGVQAGLKNTTGILNTFIGGYAGKETTTGSYSVALGYQALQANTTASNNTAVGYQAGYTNTTGTQNTYLGYWAGYLTTGSTNAFLGYGAGSSVTTGSKNTIIGGYNGNQGGLDIRTASNYIVLSDGDGNPRFVDDGTNVGFGGVVNLSGTAGVGFKSLAGRPVVVNAATANTTTVYEVYSTGASAYRFYVGLAGTVYATSTTITAISDQRLKENIRDLDEGLATVMALKPRKFDWKEGKGQDIKNARGFIAQEFETVLPDMIEEWRDPAPEGQEPYKAINANLIPTLVKAIQEQQSIIQQLTDRITILEGK